MTLPLGDRQLSIAYIISRASCELSPENRLWCPSLAKLVGLIEPSIHLISAYIRSRQLGGVLGVIIDEALSDDELNVVCDGGRALASAKCRSRAELGVLGGTPILCVSQSNAKLFADVVSTSHWA
jgi:hypothetical protein